MAKQIFTFTELQTADVDFVLSVQSAHRDIQREYINDLARAIRGG